MGLGTKTEPSGRRCARSDEPGARGSISTVPCTGASWSSSPCAKAAVPMTRVMPTASRATAGVPRRPRASAVTSAPSRKATATAAKRIGSLAPRRSLTPWATSDTRQCGPHWVRLGGCGGLCRVRVGHGDRDGENIDVLARGDGRDEFVPAGLRQPRGRQRVPAVGRGGRDLGTVRRLDLDGRAGHGLVRPEAVEEQRQGAVPRDGDELEGVREGLATRGYGLRDGRRGGAVKGGPISGRRGGVKPGHGLRTA